MVHRNRTKFCPFPNLSQAILVRRTTLALIVGFLHRKKYFRPTFIACLPSFQEADGTPETF
jgi:hypothetical protein